VTIVWMFTTSQWASESPAWQGPFDIRRSGDLVSNFRDIYYQFNVYRWKQTGDGEEFPWTSDEFYESLREGEADELAISSADPQPDTEEDSEELKASEIQTTTSPVTSGSASLEPDDDWDEEAWRQDQMKSHTVPVSDDDDEDADDEDEAFSEESSGMDTVAEPDERWNRRQEVDSPRPPHRQTKPLPRPPVTKNGPPAPTEEAFYLTPQRCLSAWEKRHADRPCNEYDFDYLLDYYDEDDILFAIEHFTEYGNWSEEIRTSSDFSDKFGEIMDEIRPPEAPSFNDEEL
jgi:hypothetical protein